MNKKTINTKLLSLLLAGAGFSLNAAAQQVTVKGHVQDQTGEPVVYATVTVPGTKTMTQTDANGNFRLNVKAGTNLRINYIGYKPAEVKADGTILVTLEDNSTLNEAVVIGYGVARKNDLTGSVTAIKPDEKNKGMVVSAQDMLQGKIAGVNVTSNGGTPGAGADIRIRGGASLTASNNPLVVIDGLAMDNEGVQGLANPLAMVNPTDIETFTVLKDASATAIYGSRGSNGVIIITTKKGRKAQKPTVSYNGYASVSMARNTLDVMNADEYRSFVENYYGKDSEAYSKLGPLTGEGTDWQKEIYRPAVSHDHNITLSGGLKNMPYRLTLGYTNQEGIIKTSEFERYTAAINLNPTFLKDHLTFNVNAKYMHANSRYADAGSAVKDATRMDPTQTVRNYDSKYDNFENYFQWGKHSDDINDPNYQGDHNFITERNAQRNPVATLNLRDDHALSDVFIGSIEGDYKIHGFEDLRLHASAGADYSTGDQRKWESPAIAGDNFYYGYNHFEEKKKYNLSLNAYAQYYKDFNENQHFDIMAGYEWQHFHREGEWSSYGLYQNSFAGSNDEGQPLAGTKYNSKGKVWKTENYLVSFFGRANYTLFQRYLLTATLRYDGSSRFKDHWALFPSVALAWRIKDEKFLKDVDFVSELKLRLGYGQTGQQEGIGDYNYFVSYNENSLPDSYYPIMGDGQLNRPDAYNGDLKWETTTTYNAGLDFGIIRGKLSGSVDFYYRKTTDLLNEVDVSAGTNFKNRVKTNIGSLENKGVEIALTYKPISTKNWYWEITGNATYNRNEITELNKSDEGYFVPTGGISAGTGNHCQAHAVGHPASSFYVFQQIYDEQGMPIEGAFVDRNGNGVAGDEGDKYFYKSPNAPWTFGLSTRLQYKNWDLGMSFRASVGNYVYDDLSADACNISKAYDSSFGNLNNVTNDLVRLNWKTYDYVLSDYFVKNASYFKCDNITLGYTFENILGGDRYKGLSGRVYLAATNVFTVTKFDGIDPEVFGGIANSVYPRPTTVQLGLNINF